MSLEFLVSYERQLVKMIGLQRRLRDK